jgi:cytochrome P450
MGAFPKLQDFDDPGFDPFLADEQVYGDFEDVYSPLAELRRKSPVVEGRYSDVIGDARWGTLARPGQREFMILGYKEVMAAAGDPDTFANGPAFEDTLRVTFGNTISVMDPPVHGRYRRIFQAAFLPRMIAEWESDIVTPVIDRLVSSFADRGHADLVEEFTHLYPFQVIYRQLALPPEETYTFQKLAVAQLLLGGGHFRPRALEASRKLGEYFKAMIDERRGQSSKDLVSVLLSAEVDGEKLSDDLIISFLRQLINAGGDTTYRETSCLLFALLTHPDQLEAVRADRKLVGPAIEEALRWEGPSAVIPRYVMRDVSLGGVLIPAGSFVELFFGVANRDETVIPDEPDKFNIFRPRTRHFGFGYGPHLCIGQHLARLEMNNALNAILDRLPNLRLDPDESPPVIRGRNLRYPRSLPVRFGGKS